MGRWFVYCDATYYPWAEIVEAPTALVAGEKYARDGVVVFPMREAKLIDHARDGADVFIERLGSRAPGG